MEEGRLPAPVFLPGKSHGQRRQVGHGPRGRKESDMTEHTHTQYRNEREVGRKKGREEKRENFNQASFPGGDEKPFAISL